MWDRICVMYTNILPKYTAVSGIIIDDITKTASNLSDCFTNAPSFWHNGMPKIKI